MSIPSLSRGLYAFLSTYAPLTAIVGTRIYPGLAPTSAVFPYVTIQELMVASHYHLDGATATFDTMAQIDVWSLEPMQAQQLAKIIRQSMDGLPAAWDGLEVDGVFVDSETDAPEPAQDGSERAYYRRILTISVWHMREVPA
jgi:uncharacterized protein DUF3168